MVDMMNSLFRALAEDRRRHCDNLQKKIVQEVKLGLAWKFKFQCENCRFTSEVYKPYEEAEISKDRNHGAAPAVMNLSLTGYGLDVYSNWNYEAQTYSDSP